MNWIILLTAWSSTEIPRYVNPRISFLKENCYKYSLNCPIQRNENPRIWFPKENLYKYSSNSPIPIYIGKAYCPVRTTIHNILQYWSVLNYWSSVWSIYPAHSVVRSGSTLITEAEIICLIIYLVTYISQYNRKMQPKILVFFTFLLCLHELL